MKIVARCCVLISNSTEARISKLWFAFCPDDDVYAKKNAKEESDEERGEKGGEQKYARGGRGREESEKDAERRTDGGSGRGRENRRRRPREGRGSRGEARRRVEGSTRNITSVLSDLHGERTFNACYRPLFPDTQANLLPRPRARRGALSLLSISLCLSPLGISRPMTVTANVSYRTSPTRVEEVI